MKAKLQTRRKQGIEPKFLCKSRKGRKKSESYKTRARNPKQNGGKEAFGGQGVSPRPAVKRERCWKEGNRLPEPDKRET